MAELGERSLSLADFQDTPRAKEAPQLKLARMARILETLGSPETKIPLVIHVSGSSGKGSTSTLVAAALASQLGDDATVGLFTSPHLHHITERIRIVTAKGSGEVQFDAISEADFTAAEVTANPSDSCL